MFYKIEGWVEAMETGYKETNEQFQRIKDMLTELLRNIQSR